MKSGRIVLVLLIVGTLGACQGRRFFTEGGTRSGRTPRASGQIFLSDAELAPVDAFISARNAQWILGDEVDVVASREYFAQVLTVNATVGLVERVDTTTADETTVTLVYRGHPGSMSVTTSPRILIGTGLTITARRKLVLHLARTKDPAVPLRLRVSAQGDAARGRKDDVQVRAPVLTLGGEMRKQGGRWTWFPIG